MTYGRRHFLTQQVLARLAYAGPTGEETREFLKASLRFIVGMTLFFFAMVAVASAAEVQEPQPVAVAKSLSPNSATRGEFLFHEDADAPLAAAPSVDTRVRFEVTGVISRAKVVQRFRNPLNAWIEGVYVFPLPEGAAVDHLRMKAGSRVIEGQIREKEQARREFQAAAAAGKRATLLEQQRPNLFTSRVANLGPLEELEVEIEYQQSLELVEGRVTIRFPLAITPRYVAGIESSLNALTGGGRLTEPESPEADEEDGGHPIASPKETLLQPPFLPPGVPSNPVAIELSLNAGFEVASLASDTHALHTEAISPSEYRARLRDEVVPSDRDFEVSWKPQPGVMPQSSVVSEKGPDGTYSLITLFPPVGERARSARIRREVTFVIDTSGSMEGVSMQQAKKALALAIEKLDPEDSFNLIQFNSITSVLFPKPVQASPENRQRALQYAGSLEAQGGTEMLPALLAALGSEGSERNAKEALRQIIFLTDGAVSNEDQLFQAIRLKLGKARLFTVGIGSAPNGHFMTKAAEFGRGTFTFISDASVVERQMSELFAKVESPALSDIQVSFDGVPSESVEIWPDRIPDLYLGEPLVVSARFETAPSHIRIVGRRDGERFETVAPFVEGDKGRGINVLWARRKIQSLLDGVHDGDDPEAARAQVVSLGLAHHLVTRYTSLVAVDLTNARPPEERTAAALVPVSLPNGATFGTLPRSATPATLYLVQGLAASVLALGLFMVSRRS